MISSLSAQAGRIYTQFGDSSSGIVAPIRSDGSGGAFVPVVVVPTARGGGTSKRKRTYPEYYSRQFFGREIQLPADDVSRQVAETVLEQAAGVLDDLNERDAKYDELLRVAEQLVRITARQVESRQIYEAVQRVAAEVQAKRDAEIRDYLQAVEEENEVMEIMQLL